MLTNNQSTSPVNPNQLRSNRQYAARFLVNEIEKSGSSKQSATSLFARLTKEFSRLQGRKMEEKELWRLFGVGNREKFLNSISDTVKHDILNDFLWIDNAVPPQPVQSSNKKKVDTWASQLARDTLIKSISDNPLKRINIGQVVDVFKEALTKKLGRSFSTQEVYEIMEFSSLSQLLDHYADAFTRYKDGGSTYVRLATKDEKSKLSVQTNATPPPSSPRLDRNITSVPTPIEVVIVPNVTAVSVPNHITVSNSSLDDILEKKSWANYLACEILTKEIALSTSKSIEQSQFYTILAAAFSERLGKKVSVGDTSFILGSNISTFLLQHTDKFLVLKQGGEYNIYLVKKDMASVIPPSTASPSSSSVLAPFFRPASSAPSALVLTSPYTSSPSNAHIGPQAASSPLIDLQIFLLQKCSLIAVDCEFANEEVVLVQIAANLNNNLECYLFDLLSDREKTIESLKTILEDSKIVKIVHDCRHDSLLLNKIGIQMNNVIDTQVYHAMMSQMGELYGCPNENTDKLTRRIGLNKLLERYSLKTVENKEAMHRIFDTQPNFWRNRPLTKEMIEYAKDDAILLLELYYKMENQATSDFNLVSKTLSSRLASSYQNSVSRMIGIIRNLTFIDHKAVYDTLEKVVPLSAAQIQEKRKLNDAEVPLLIRCLPPQLRLFLERIQCEYPDKVLFEIVVDLHRKVVVHFIDDTEFVLPILITPADLDEAIKALQDSQLEDFLEEEKQSFMSSLTSYIPIIGSPVSSRAKRSFTSDNRIGIPMTLHRISAIRDKYNQIAGLTYRIGRYISGAAEMIQDIVYGLENQSLLLLGPPGTGKTSLLRDIIRILADEVKKRVVVVDTSNEIAGDGSSAHICIGRARRMQVRFREQQDKILIEAVQNHNPQVIVIDEIGTSAEVAAAATIAQRGVTMVATAHGNDLHSLMKNPPLLKLIGGIKDVILGDMEAKKRAENPKEAKKTVLERAGAPIFDIVIELIGRNRWRIHRNVGKTIDELLAGRKPVVEERWKDEDGTMHSEFKIKFEFDGLKDLE